MSSSGHGCVVAEAATESTVRGEAELLRFALFAGVDPDVLSDLQRRGEVRVIEPGEPLLRAGQENRCLFLLLSGRLSVTLPGSDIPIATLDPGSTVGELSVLDRGPVCADVVCRDRARVLIVDEASFWRLVADSHGFALNLLLELAQRLRNNNDKVSENLRDREELRRAAMFDALTGVHNRRWLDMMAVRLWRRKRFDGAPLAVLVIDVDHFKRYNDTWGHAAGDRVLRLVAGTLAEQLRPTDLMARWGGEEFAAMLPSTDLQGALACAERLRAAVAGLEIEPADGCALPNPTVSIGVAIMAREETPEMLFAAADRALYRAKRGGRNRVESAEDLALVAAV